ncbi:MAG: hypothetical protein ACYCT1_11235 [Steroidobacteraceae bacterium]
MITNSQSGANIQEIAGRICRINTPVSIADGPGKLSFNQHLVVCAVFAFRAMAERQNWDEWRLKNTPHHWTDDMAPHRWNYMISTRIALLSLTLICARASVASESVVSAVNAINVAALESLSTSAPTAPQKLLATGALLALRHEDAKAIAMLMPVARSPGARSVRATAYLVLSDVYCRNQRYLACYSAIHVAHELSPESVNMAYRQTMFLPMRSLV